MYWPSMSRGTISNNSLKTWNTLLSSGMNTHGSSVNYIICLRWNFRNKPKFCKVRNCHLQLNWMDFFSDWPKVFQLSDLRPSTGFKHAILNTSHLRALRHWLLCCLGVKMIPERRPLHSKKNSSSLSNLTIINIMVIDTIQLNPQIWFLRKYLTYV